VTEQQNDQTIDETTEVTDTVSETPDVETTETPEVDEGREAARYRRRLRDTEKERDALLERVDTLRRSAIDTEVTVKHQIPTDGFWATGITVDALLDDDGNIDTEKVAVAARDAIYRLGVRRPLRNYVPSEGASPASRSSGSRWTEAFR